MTEEDALARIKYFYVFIKLLQDPFKEYRKGCKKYLLIPSNPYIPFLPRCIFVCCLMSVC